MNANEIYNLIQTARSEYNYFGLRAMTPCGNIDVTVKVGDMPRNSYHWDDGESTGEEINGVCALGIDADDEQEQIEKVIKMLKCYSGKQIALIGSLWHEYGQDEGEIILRGNETVLAEWKR
jgi:hypothetical protein